MKYIIMDYRDGELFADEFNSAEEAIETAEAEWNNLSDHDKKHRTEFFVLESVNQNKDAEDHFDGNEVRRWK